MENGSIGDLTTLGRVLLKRWKRHKQRLLQVVDVVAQKLNEVVAISITEEENDLEENGPWGGRPVRIKTIVNENPTGRRITSARTTKRLYIRHRNFDKGLLYKESFTRK